jgi:pseudouridine kinase
VCWCDALGRTGHRAATQAVVVNTSGAGDALLAGLVHGHLHAWSLERSLAFSMGCAELTLASTLPNHPEMSSDVVMRLLERIVEAH